MFTLVILSSEFLTLYLKSPEHMQYPCTGMDMTDFPERDGKRVDLIVPIQQVAAGFTSSLTLPLGIKATSAGDVSSQALHIFILCFASPQCKKLYLVSCGVIVSNPGQVICHISAFQSRDVWSTKGTDFEIYARTCSDLQFSLIAKIPYQQHASVAQQMTRRNKFKKLKMVHLHISDCSLHLHWYSNCCESNG